MQEQLGIFLEELRSLLQSRSAKQEQVKQLGKSSLLRQHELASVLYASLCKQVGLEIPSFPLKQIESGAVPLFEKGYFPWGALPYPYEHAEIGFLCKKLGMHEIAEKMANWQSTFACDHQKRPLAFLFTQENGHPFHALEQLQSAFLENFSNSSCLNIDRDLGLAIFKTENSTIACAASGCKSGMGCYLFKEMGILNFGPQSASLAKCDDFGLAGKPIYFEPVLSSEGFKVCYQTRLASASSRKTPFPTLKDSGYSGLWIKCEASLDQKEFQLSTELEGCGSLENRVFVFFGKGEFCFVAGSHKLNPKSLNRYQGPPKQVAFQGKEGKVILEPLEGVEKMEVIPLAGGNCFWGADFLVAFTYASPRQKYVLKNQG